MGSINQVYKIQYVKMWIHLSARKKIPFCRCKNGSESLFKSVVTAFSLQKTLQHYVTTVRESLLVS